MYFSGQYIAELENNMMTVIVALPVKAMEQ